MSSESGKRRKVTPPQAKATLSEACTCPSAAPVLPLSLVGGDSPEGRRVAYMAVVIQQVIGQLQLVERHDLLHPLGTLSRRIRVVVHSARCGRVGLASHQPGGAMEGIPRAT